jgi:hypothetical protein
MIHRTSHSQPGPGHDVGVNLRRRQVFMSELILNAADISPRFQQMRGK